MILLLSVVLAALVVVGVPIAFSMILATALAIWAVGEIPMVTIAQRLGSGVENFTYLAIPLFILAGAIMDEAGISIRLVRLARALVGHIRGGLGMVVVVSEIFFSGISGASLSDASAIGSLMFPSLRDAGYQPARATAIIAASCAMGILIPPCLTMVILGALAGVSVSALFIAGFLPGFLMALALMVLIYVQARRGLVPAGEAPASWRETWATFKAALLPLFMPVIIFGGILGGVFSPTEAAAVAVLYAAVLGMLVYRKITVRKLVEIFVQTSITTGAIGLIVGAAGAFAWLLALKGVPAAVAGAVTSLSTNPVVFLVAANLIFMFFGAVLDGIPALILFLPILMPVANALGIDPLHFTLLSVASLGIGLIIPPVGIMLLVICSITKTPVGAVTRVMTPYLAILGVCLLVIIAVPWFVLVLPRLTGF